MKSGAAAFCTCVSKLSCDGGFSLLQSTIFRLSKLSRTMPTRREARRILHLFPRYPIFLLDGSASFQSYASTIWRFFAVVGALLFLIATITFITLPAIFIVDTDIDYFGNNHCLRVHNILGRILVLCPSSSRVIWCSGGLSRQQKGSDLWRYDVVVVTGHRRLLFDRNVPLCGNHQGVYT